MAELINLKKEEFAKANDALDAVLAVRDLPHDIVRDAAIMRFSFCAELSWKTLKVYLSEKSGAEILVPKAAYREALRADMLSEDEAETCLRMVDDRNRLAHDYNEKFAQKLYARIVDEYVSVLRKIEKGIRE